MHTPGHDDPCEFTCPKTGRKFRRPVSKRGWARWIIPLIGCGSLLWFLLRVIPKPSRALYPCMRVAAPLASGFLVWLLGLSAIMAFRRAWMLARRARYALAGICLLIGVAAIWTAVVRGPLGKVYGFTPTDPPNTPMGVGKGIHPGRVSWVWDPDATQGDVLWDCSTGYFWDENHNNQAVIDTMMGKTICWLAGESSDTAAWDALFRFNNRARGRGDRGYQPGEKIAIKVNLNTTIDWGYPGWNGIDLVYDETMYARNTDNDPDMTPQAIKALLRQLTTKAGVPQGDIYIYDSVRYWSDKFWVSMHTEFPDVHFADVQGYLGRDRCIPTDQPVIFYSKKNAAGEQVSDSLPTFVVDAGYMINFAMLKKTAIGITVCGKNHFGSLCRNPVHVHEFAWRGDLGLNRQVMGDYNPYVDYMGHPDLGGKTFLYLVDGLWGGWLYGEDPSSMPRKWQIAPFNNDWPSSFFASQDPVAIDSVALDFLRSEDPDIAEAADNYLHEAALIPNSPSGTSYDPTGKGTPLTAPLGVHEHWNNVTGKLYSRNMGLNEGIELVSDPPPTAVNDSYTTSAVLTVETPGVLTNDSDPDGQVLTARLETGPAHGQLQLNANGSFTYTPNSNFSGEDNFVYRAWDGRTASGTATATINVTPITSPPVAVDDWYRISGNSLLTVKAPGLLSNDSGLVGHAVTVHLVSGPTYGKLNLHTDGSFTYRGSFFRPPIDSFTYRVLNGATSSNVARVYLSQRKYHPDLKIRTVMSKYIGMNIYNLSGAGQTVMQRVRYGNDALYFIQIENDGTKLDNLVITGPKGGNGWTVTYYTLDNKDITDQVTGDGWVLPGKTRQASATLLVKVTPNSGASRGSSLTLPVTASSDSNPLEKDVVKAVTRVQ